MLGVRRTTCNDMCYFESGYVPIHAIVKSKQRKFFVNMYRERADLVDDPFRFVLDLVLSNRYNTRKYCHNLIHDVDVNDCQLEVNSIKTKLARSDSLRRVVYCNVMNVSLAVHDLYTKKNNIF